MAKVKSYNGKHVTPVIEDPRNIANPDFFFYGDAHDKTSLSPIYDKYARLSSPSSWSNWGSMYNTMSSNMWCSFAVKKHTTWVMKPDSTSYSDDQSQSMREVGWNRYMDASEMKSPYVQLIDDGTQKTIMLQWHNQYNPSTANYYLMWQNIADTTSMANLPPNSVYTSTAPGSYNSTPFYGDEVINGRYVGTSDYTSSSSYRYSDNHRWVGWYTHPSYTGANNSTLNMIQYGSALQHLGKSSVTGNRLYFEHNPKNTSSYSYGAGYARLFDVNYSSGTGAPTLTTNTNLQGSIAAGGTSQGGNFMNGQPSANSHARVWATKTFTDPRTATKKAWYVPYWDTYYNFHPLLYTWNTLDDTMAREDDITITGDLSSVHMDVQSANTKSGSGDNYRYGHYGYWCDQFTSGGNQYISTVAMNGRLQWFDATEGGRTMISYAIDAADPKALTYHSKYTFSKTITTTCYLNDARTLMAFFYTGGCFIMSWNNATGWGLTATITDHISVMGRDSTDRIWYAVVNAQHGANSNGMDIHLLSPTLPVAVTLTPAASSYTYAGSAINSTVGIDARNASGTRLATSVKLVIEGSSMTFTGGATTVTATSSASATVDVPIIVTGSGYSNIIASIEI